jgi:hypothetical protein
MTIKETCRDFDQPPKSLTGLKVVVQLMQGQDGNKQTVPPVTKLQFVKTD